MPTNPTPSDVHVDAILTQISVAWLQDTSTFVATNLFPEVPVSKQSDKYYVYDKGDWFRDEAEKRAPATESAGSGYRIGTDNYSCEVYAFHKDVDDQTRANADNPINLDADASQFVTQRMLLRMERDWAATCWTTGVWTTDLTGVDANPSTGEFLQWDDASSTPVTDIENAKREVLAITGFMPNVLVLGYDVYVQLKQHPSIYDRLKHTTSENITREILARFFEVDRVIVSQAIVNTGNVENDASGADTFSFVFGKQAWLGYVTATPGILQPTAGYRFSWTGVSDGLGQTIGTSRIRMPELRADRVESQMAWDFKVVAPDLGVFFASAVA
jgi:hypothetical protein